MLSSKEVKHKPKARKGIRKPSKHILQHLAPIKKVEVEITLKKLHFAQQQIINECSRFNVVDCGRRFGKTTLAVEILASPDNKEHGFLNGWPVAYGTPTYKMLSEVWREVLDIFNPIISHKSETEKRIEFINGGSIDFWSLEDYNTIRGRKYKDFVIDEAAMVRDLKEAWLKVIRATLTDLIGSCWFLSTPKGKNNYFYELYKLMGHFAGWMSWQFPTAANPFISEQEIKEVQGQMDPLTFAQEYLASFVTENLDAWAYTFDPAKHLGPTEIDPTHEVYLSFDFNRNPITCAVFQHYGSLVKPIIRGIEQIKLPNSDIYKLCDYIRAAYGGRLFIVTGDATGKASSALVQDNLNYYTVIKKELDLTQGQMKVPSVNPPVKENRVLFNSILHNHDVKLDPEKCKGLIFDLEHARVLPDGNLEKMDRNDPTQQLDALDCCRYYFTTFHKHLLRL